MEKKGSLILGNKAEDPDEKEKGKKDGVKPKRTNKWHITIDKYSDYIKEI